MLIGKNWKVEGQGLNVTLFRKIRRTNKTTGKTYEDWRIAGYFATVANALHELVNQKIRDTELKDFQTIKDEIDKLHQMIERCLNRSTAITEATGG